MNYQSNIEKFLRIVDKGSQDVPFLLNAIQSRYINSDMTGRDVILKARQQGFSSVILAQYTLDFISRDNTRNVIVADIADNAMELLDRVKFYIKSFQETSQVEVPLKYNSKYELYNEGNGSRYTIGTADNAEFGRSKTITNLHFSEAAFYPHLENMIAGAGQAVVEDGKFILETTANGFNYFKEFWEDCKAGNKPFKPLFYKASDFYPAEFLEKKRLELGARKFKQEYPESDVEAFLSSGEMFFESESLKYYYDNSKEPIGDSLIY